MAKIKGLYHPSMAWFSPIKLPEQRYKSALTQHGGGVDIGDVKVRPLIPAARISKYGVRARIGDVQTLFYTSQDLARLLKVSPTALTLWVKEGALPEPYAISTYTNGRLLRYWTYGQVMAIVYVFNDLFRQGAKGITRRHTMHLKLLKYGAAYELELEINRNLLKKQEDAAVVVEIEAPKMRDKTGPSFGVTFE